MLTLRGENAGAQDTQDVMVESNNVEIEGTTARPVLDAVCMAELRALDPSGKAQLVRRVLVAYRTSIVKLLEQMRIARGADMWDDVSRVAHTLKSSSASIGALALSTLCSDIERLLRAGDHAAAAPLVDRFHAEATRVDDAVAAALDEIGAA